MIKLISVYPLQNLLKQVFKIKINSRRLSKNYFKPEVWGGTKTWDRDSGRHRQWWIWLNSWENSFSRKYCWCFDEKKNTFLPLKPKATNAISNGPAKQHNAIVEFITKRKFGVQTRHFCQMT